MAVSALMAGFAADYLIDAGKVERLRQRISADARRLNSVLRISPGWTAKILRNVLDLTASWIIMVLIQERYLRANFSRTISGAGVEVWPCGHASAAGHLRGSIGDARTLLGRNYLCRCAEANSVHLPGNRL